MNITRVGIAAVIVFVGCVTAFGQGDPTPRPVPYYTAPGVAVQLPTFNFFSVVTTVNVPDRGSAYMGGVNRSSSGSTSRGGIPGLGRNRGIGGGASGSSMTVHATIHDFDEMDRLLLEQADAMQRAANRVPTETERRAAGLAASVGHDAPVSVAQLAREASDKSAQSPPSESLEALRQRNLEAERQRDREATDYYVKAQECESRGKYGAAKVYYQMAARRATGQLKGEALARYAFLQGGSGPGNVASNDSP